MGFFLFEITIANSRVVLDIFMMNIEIDDHKTMSKTTTEIFQLPNMVKCQIILKKNTTNII